MHILCIDAGSYSVKYISSFVDKRRTSHVDMSEIVVKDYMADHEGLTFEECQTSIIQEIIDSVARPETRIIYQAGNEMMTTRFVTLPVKSKKKAELMLPFQLEEDIPYALSEIHYAYRMEGQKNQHVALVELARLSVFEENLNLLREKDILPNILTTEASVVENYFNQYPIAGPFCVLDIGHKTTKAYFFYNSRLLTTHVSYVGGQHINEMISQTYQIDLDEAILYKHQNAFMLTSGQYDDVEPTQREFAASMDRIFSHLVADFTRWKIGLKVNFGLSIGQVFITGGTSNIKNLTNYLTEKWDTKVTLLETFENVENEKIGLSANRRLLFSLANMMAVGLKKKNRFVNLLTGKYTQTGASELPIHSMAFIGLRVTIVMVIAALSLLTERIFIGKDIQAVNAKLASVMKNNELQISGRLRRSISTNPAPVLEGLVKRQRAVKQEISTLQSAIEIQSLSPLVVISQAAASSQATLTEFSSNDTGEVNATFTAEKVEDLTALKSGLERSNLNGIKIEIDEGKLQLRLSAGI